MRYILALGAVGLGALGAFGLQACGDGGGGITEKPIARMEVREGERPVIQNGTLIVSGAAATRVRLVNTGNADLLIKSVEVESTVAGAFAVSPQPSAAAPVVIAPEGAPHELTITYDASAVAEGQRPKATIRIETNTTIDGDSFTFYAMPGTIISKLVVQPGVIDFETVDSGTSSTKPMNILNTGAAPLAISQVRLSGDGGFTASVAGKTFTSGAGGAVTLSEPITIDPSSARQVDITFASSGQGPARAELTFISNDPGAPDGTTARLLANLAGPCVRAIPSRLDFGAKPVGQASTLTVELESCGDRDVLVSSVALADDGGGLFSVAPFGAPVTIPAGQRIPIPVGYFPEAIAALGSDGLYINDRGILRVESNGYIDTLDVPLSGFGSGGTCPIAGIEVTEGDEVVPQTELHLISRSSSPSGAPITGWKWSVLQPDHSVSSFFPGAAVESPTFTPNIVGTYIFRLEVTDAQGQKSCVPAEYTVEVTSDDAIHVELVWRTPGDINETDEGSGPTFSRGSDVDLHFLHPFSAERFFVDNYDCYWFAPTLDWPPIGADGDPHLDRDDRDGGGPENLNMKVPEDGAIYWVGVHYYNDWGYGNALATVRVYIYGVLREQWTEVQVTNAALWESHTIEWPSGRVTRVLVDGQPKITPGYPLPF